MKKPRRELTPEEKADAQRLLAIFLSEKAKAKARGGKLTQAEIAEEFGWETQSTVSQYLNGKIPLNLDAALKFAKIFNVALSDFSSSLAKQLPQNTLKRELRGVGSPATQSVPVISWVDLAKDIRPSEIASKVKPEGQAVRVGRLSENAFALKVMGESMFNPQSDLSFADSETIYVEPGVEPSHEDCVIMLDSEGQPLFRQFLKESNGTFLKPLNPSWANERIRISDDLRLVGVVVGKYVSYR